MKRDIKVNYGILSSIVSDLKQYNEAIESIDGLLININKKLENENDGKAIEALRNKYDKLKVQIDSCKEETKDLYNIFNNYINDMTDIIKPIDEQKMMRVSRNDIYFNKVSIGNACDNIGSIMSGILTSLGSAGTLLTSGTKIKNNIVKMYAISSLAKATSQSLQNDMDDINKLYNENVISYENMDDTYKSKASELYDKYSSVWEKFTTTVGGIGKASVDIVKGFFSSLVGLVKGVFDILKAAVVYIGAGFGAISEKITGDAPDCLKSCERKVKEYNKTIVEIVKDPFSLIEGLSQTLNDTYEEKGIAYMGGYVVGEVAQVLLLKKVSGAKSAKGIDGVEDAAKTVKSVDKAEDGSKIAKESSAIKGVGQAKFQYKHNPSDSPKVLLDAVEDTNAVYGYRPNDIGSLKKFVKYDWTDSDVVAKFRENRLRYHIENDGYRELVNSMRADGHSDVEIAKTLVEKRNANRLSSYIDENGKISDIELYNQAKEHCVTYEQLKHGINGNPGKSDLQIIESAMKGNEGMDACCGLYDDYYYTYK